MTPAVPDIGPLQLVLALVFVLAAQACSVAFRLGLTRDLAVGTVRTFAQLFLMGYVLKLLFDLRISWLMVGVFAFMVAAATHTIAGRVREKRIPYRWTLFATMFVCYLAVSVTVTGVVVGAQPWWEPRFFIPLAGMVIGNSMTALAVALERLFAGLRSRRAEVEMRLALGASAAEASRPIVREAVRAGMIPSINSMMGVGLVFLPGMMTGQILAGADPLTAIRYQIVVMLMLAASCALGAAATVLLVRRRCFGPAQQLVLGPAPPEKSRRTL